MRCYVTIHQSVRLVKKLGKFKTNSFLALEMIARNRVLVKLKLKTNDRTKYLNPTSFA